MRGHPVLGVLAAIIVIGAIIGAATKGGQSGGSPHAASHHARRTLSHDPLAHHRGYAGLGATRAAFDAGNNVSEPANPAAAPGVFWYTVLETDAAHRVVAYRVSGVTEPPMSARAWLTLGGGTMLPGPYVAPIRTSRNCYVWRDKALQRLTGDSYAVSFTYPEPSWVEVFAQRKPECP
ncbi:MAG TPA: hypothetical protein VGF95_14450 [Solirubrobacteraceae bacterium]|jgi:hypothetical protein